MTITQVVVLAVAIVLLFFVIKFLIKNFIRLVMFIILAFIAIVGYCKLNSINMLDDAKAYIIKKFQP